MRDENTSKCVMHGYFMIGLAQAVSPERLELLLVYLVREKKGNE
jgi:hypothetical protein